MCSYIFIRGWAQEKFNLGADLFNQHHLEEGLKCYAPTRMEWLALKLNLDNHYFRDEEDDSLNGHGYMRLYSWSGSDLLVTIHDKLNVKHENTKTAVNDVWLNVFPQRESMVWIG